MTNLSSPPHVTVNLAGPLDQVNTWVSQWGTGAQILGGTILGICAIVVGIQIGTKAVANDNASGTRQGISKLTQVILAGIVIGAALLLVPMIVNIGKGSGTPAPAEPAAAPTAPA